jgi:hypothetical protein
MKLTSELLRKIVAEETAKMRRTRQAEAKGLGKMKDVEGVKADEVDADEYAGTLERKVDHAKALKTEEARLMRRLANIREQRRRLVRELVD